MAHQLVFTTCPDLETAHAIAGLLVQGRLAACVSIIPKIQSVYEWKGQITTDEEYLLFIKTRADKYPELERVIRERHPYELPEIIAVPIERGLPPYLAWIDTCVEPKK